MPLDLPSAHVLCVYNANATPSLAINLLPDHSKFRGYGLEVKPYLPYYCTLRLYDLYSPVWHY